MVELCWAEFEAEVGDYLDFRRFRAEGAFRGTPGDCARPGRPPASPPPARCCTGSRFAKRGYSRPQRLEQPFRVC
jgi:hypothetical protein